MHRLFASRAMLVACAVAIAVCPGCKRISGEKEIEAHINAGSEYYSEMKEGMTASESAMYTREDLYYATRLSHARNAEEADFENRKEHIPEALYGYGVNYGLLPDEAYGIYKTNTETLAAMTEEDLSDFLTCAGGFISSYYTFDYRDGLSKVADELSYYMSPRNATKYALNSDIQHNLNNQLISDCRFLTDKSLIYIDDAGYYRIRGRLFTYIDYIMGAGTINYNMSPGKWYYYDVELAFIKDTAPGEWDHANYCFTLYYNMTGVEEVPYEDIEKYLL